MLTQASFDELCWPQTADQENILSLLSTFYVKKNESSMDALLLIPCGVHMADQDQIQDHLILKPNPVCFFSAVFLFPGGEAKNNPIELIPYYMSMLCHFPTYSLF